MIFAYLILAHKNPQQLSRLVRALMYDDVYIIIHIDKKVRPDEFSNLLPVSDNVIFSRQKQVSWGGFGMIEATLEMMRTMYACNIQPDYVHLISGQDFPLQPYGEILRFFRENRGKNFLEAHTIPSPRLSELGLNRIQYKWFVEDEGCPRAAQLVDIQRQRNMIRSFFDDIQPYNGSQWWSLTGDCVQWLYQTCRPGNRLYDFYKYTFCPDEMLFHTMLLNSEWKDSITDNNLRCINWNTGPEYPKIWRRGDFDSLTASGKLFARKFDDTVDNAVLDKLEVYMRKPQPTKKSIIIFRFHKNPHICLNRLEILKFYNPDIPIYGIYGGNEDDFRQFDDLLHEHISGIYIIKNRDREWKWKNFDLALRDWYNNFGKHIDFDMAYVSEWDLPVFGSLKEIYAGISNGEVGLTGLIPLSSIENQWFWTAGTQRDEYIQLFEFAKDTYKYSKTPMASLGPGLCLPKSFLADYSAMTVPELCNDEIRVPLFAQISGYIIRDTGFFRDWHNPRERQYFNCDTQPIASDTIAGELKNGSRRVFHPFRDIYPLHRLKELKKHKAVPKIIHQIWSDKHQPLPTFCASLAETWKARHPDWKYILWNEEMMDSFVDLVYPGLSEFYHSLPYDMQRWECHTVSYFVQNGGHACGLRLRMFEKYRAVAD
jgi:hypothetical protein